MPFAINTIERLAAAGWQVDVFLWEESTENRSERFSSRVVFHHQTTPRPGLRRIQLSVRFMTSWNYASVFGLGQIGSYLGGIVSIASQCPLVVLNDEFPSCWPQSPWVALERWAAKRASVIVVPSTDRIVPLSEELELSCAKTFVAVRNTPQLSYPLERHDWHELLGIPVGQRIFLHAGSLADWAEIPEILTSVVCWPADAVLLLHSRNVGEQAMYRQQLSHIDVPGKVYWSSTPLSEARLNSLVSYCDGNFALYRNIGPNFVHIGTSSGKLMRSLVCGTPVIASDYDSLAFVTREGVGIQVTHPSEIPSAIRELVQKGSSYRERCLSFAAQERVLAQRNWDNLSAALSNFIDLNRPPL
jgi:hypothetical protein